MGVRTLIAILTLSLLLTLIITGTLAVVSAIEPQLDPTPHDFTTTLIIIYILLTLALILTLDDNKILECIP